MDTLKFIKNALNKPFFLNGLFIFTFLISIFYPASFVKAGLLSSFIQFLTGPEDKQGLDLGAAISFPILGSQTPQSWIDDTAGLRDDFNSLSATQDSALIASRNPLGTLSNSAEDKILIYTVKLGDTPSSIADSFGISLNTLLWANNIRNPHLIKTGDELVILPVTGIQYEVKKGDTLNSIAKQFKGDINEISSFNGLVIGEPLHIGATIVIPDGELVPQPTLSQPNINSSRFAGLPDIKGFFLRPIFGGRKSRGIHGFNGIDLANSCGLPVLASAEGTVIITRSDGWNGGYGRYLVINHANGTQTLYAHLLNVLASVGQKIAQGSQIAVIGSSGNSTGCHVHFEVRGARNPF